jgi:hypothetical protein
VPKIEATARTIKRGIVSRSEDRAAQREGRNPFSFSVDNGYLRTKNTKLNHSTAKPQPKILYWTQMNTDKHRFYWPKNQRKKTEWDTDEHGYTRIRIHEKTQQKLKTLQNSSTEVAEHAEY